MTEPLIARMTAEELGRFLEDHFPGMNSRESRFTVEAVNGRSVRLRMSYHDRMLRPGGTISGPAMFALADISMYAAVLALVGPRLLAVTTSLNINFLRKPGPADMLGEATILKLGKRLAVGEIGLRSVGEDELVAHATATYAIPAE
ncbi:MULTISPECIES: PaaI family thioesterase [Rhodomicrobium]|uniref:PaaI family thioesterase n=1 Tax=Rhodomicrobium TaxID=1068 RepID=UPI001FD9FAFC|nr:MULTISPECIES: PaaI family thioesterase [Rhodomicrobium]